MFICDVTGSVCETNLSLKKKKTLFQAEDLVQRLSDLENSASCDASVRERIAALPPEVSDISHLDKIQGMLYDVVYE